MNELLKRLTHLKEAQQEAIDAIQKTSPDIQTAVAALEAALKALEQGLTVNNTALAYMMNANNQALAAIKGEAN